MLVHRGRVWLLWPSSCLPGVLFGSQAFLALRWTALGMILGEVTSRCGFTWRLSLPTWGSMWMGLPTLYTGLRSVAAKQGNMAFCQSSSYLVTAVGSDTFQGM
jgi:hypothetical protein